MMRRNENTIVILCFLALSLFGMESFYQNTRITAAEYYRRGMVFLEKKNGGPNYNLAFSHLKRAVEKGYAEACFPLSRCYELGWGTGVDQNKSKELLQQVDNAVLLKQVESAEKEQGDAERFRWLRILAARNHIPSLMSIAQAYRTGRGTAVDPAKAIECYRKAVELKEPKARLSLIRLLYQEKKYEEAFKELSEIGYDGDTEVETLLGHCYFNGFGCPKDYGFAFVWYEKAANKNHAVAQRQLGICYASGYGVLKDETKAVEWLRKAAEQGDKAAKKLLPELEKSQRSGE